MVTIGLSRTISMINGEFRRKSPISHPRLFITAAEGYPWNWVSAQASEETRMTGYQMIEKVLR